MTVARLIRDFSRHQNVVQVTDVRDQIVEWGFYGKIIISPFDKSADDLLGTMVEFQIVKPYATQSEMYVVRYNRNTSLGWQRLVCVKELVHSIDPVTLKVASKVQLNDMLGQLLLKEMPPAKKSAPALFEDIAVFQALAILCPEEAREGVYADYHSPGSLLTLKDVAARFVIPEEMAGHLMAPTWQSFRNLMAEDQNEKNAC